MKIFELPIFLFLITILVFSCVNIDYDKINKELTSVKVFHSRSSSVVKNGPNGRGIMMILR